MQSLLLTVGPPVEALQVQKTVPIATSGYQKIAVTGGVLGALSYVTEYGPQPNGPTWDLCLDAEGNIAVADDPYAVAQDVASAVRTFLGEVWYDTTLGIPYFEQVLGKSPPASLLRNFFETAAKTVPGVVAAAATIDSVVDRVVNGQIQITTSSGVTISVGL